LTAPVSEPVIGAGLSHRHLSQSRGPSQLAFAFHTVANLCVLAWRTAVATRGAKYRFFEHLRTITAYIVFPNWHSLLTAIADPKAQPP
jgi:hypothetical protein